MKIATKPLALLACATMAATGFTAAPAADGTAHDWVYGDAELPEKWSNTNASYASCDAGMMQSPIDLSDFNGRGDLQIGASYGETTGKLKVGRAEIKIDVSPGMGLISGKRL